MECRNVKVSWPVDTEGSIAGRQLHGGFTFTEAQTSAMLGLSCLVLFFSVWEAVVALHWISSLVLPRPTSVAMAAVELARKGELGQALLTTLTLLAASVVMATLIGIPIGYLLYRNRLWGKAFEPILGAIFASPLPLMYPIFLVIFGRTYGAILCLATIYALIPIIMNTREALLSVRPTLIWVGRSFGAGETTIFWKIVVPAAAPLMFSGVKLGVIYALLAVVAFEFLTDLGGLGRLLSELNYKFKIPETFVVTLAAIVISWLVLFIVSRFERRIGKRR